MCRINILSSQLQHFIVKKIRRCNKCNFISCCLWTLQNVFHCLCFTCSIWSPIPYLAGTQTQITFSSEWDAGLCEFGHTSHSYKTINKAAYCTCALCGMKCTSVRERMHFSCCSELRNGVCTSVCTK